MLIKYSHIQEKSIVDGPGSRTVFFMQGCKVRCDGCQNRKLWSFEGGTEVDVQHAAKVLASIAENKQITISGGEPFLQPHALGQLVILLDLVYHCHIILYTGYTLEQLVDRNNLLEFANEVVLAHVNILVDGPYVKALDDDTIIYRGSRNQRAIDLKKSKLPSYTTGTIVELDWNNPEVVIDENGNSFFPIGLTEIGAEIGEVKNTRMCGQTGGAK